MTLTIQPPTDLREAEDTRLWCLHAIGPDDVHPAPDFETAQRWAIWANESFAGHADILRHVVAVWPWDAESHAAGLPEAVRLWTPRAALASATTTPASAREAATDLRTRLSVMGIELTDDARTAINQAFLAIPTPVAEVGSMRSELLDAHGRAACFADKCSGCADNVKAISAALSATAPQQGEAFTPAGEFAISTGDPRFDPKQPAFINGYRFVPQAVDLPQQGEAGVRAAWQRVASALDGIPGGMHADLEDAASAMETALAQSPAPDATVREKVVAELAKLHNAARGCEFDLRPADGPIARLTLFVHQHGDAILAALAHPQPIDAGEDGPLLAPPNSLPAGCHCKDICGAPVMMGRQQPCRRPGGIPGQAAPDATPADALSDGRGE